MSASRREKLEGGVADPAVRVREHAAEHRVALRPVLLQPGRDVVRRRLDRLLPFDTVEGDVRVLGTRDALQDPDRQAIRRLAR